MIGLHQGRNGQNLPQALRDLIATNGSVLALGF